jgi:hypothetical protein
MRVTAAAHITPMYRGQPRRPAPHTNPAAAPAGADGLKRPARPHHQWDHPIDHLVAETTPVSRTKVRPGARNTRALSSPPTTGGTMS